MYSPKTIDQLNNAISEAIDYLEKSYRGNSLTDLYFIVDIDSNELTIYDDEQNLVNQTIITGWSGLVEDEIINLLRNSLQDLDFDNKFDKLNLFKPFSVNYADEDFVVLEELLLIEDNSIVRLEDDFLKRIDQDFDDFLSKLLKE